MIFILKEYKMLIGFTLYIFIWIENIINFIINYRWLFWWNTHWTSLIIVHMLIFQKFSRIFLNFIFSMFVQTYLLKKAFWFFRWCNNLFYFFFNFFRAFFQSNLNNNIHFIIDLKLILYQIHIKYPTIWSIWSFILLFIINQ